ncbi:putative copper chaperone for respiratory chain complex IV [Myriangium duriaei CBS 260.36]|uniref:Copper chaperone for respiratory chain complex IV n=1 Tax=Myriangium duriaei CBS 260.36 TaxID=1168546 RepID=A0A9P4JAG6_9PEZI|nr:putative copper chaperone for respiratory chain complex IV [Myriangium duriaei CBS 260.36]
MSAPATRSIADSTASSPANLANELKPQGEAAAKYKPCCVCKDEKAARDECMLFSNSADPQKECQDMVSRYKTCMKGYGFNI